MATVRFSQELKDKILANARVVFSKQVEEATNSRPSHEWGDKIYNTLFGVHVPAFNAVPQEFLKMTKSIQVEQVGGTHCGLKFELSTQRPWPHEFKATHLAAKHGYYGDEIDLKDDLAWGELFAEVKAWQDRKAAVTERREKFVEQIRQVIEAHATLAPALKMLPALWDLIPEPVKEKHREVKEREKKVVELDVDIGAITAAVAFHKMTR